MWKRCPICARQQAAAAQNHARPRNINVPPHLNKNLDEGRQRIGVLVAEQVDRLEGGCTASSACEHLHTSQPTKLHVRS
jgi:phosphoglycerate dehydrogenase-like enzyme